MLALLAAVMLAGSDAAQQGKDETEAMLKPDAADDQGLPARFALHLPPVSLDIPPAPFAEEGDAALDSLRPPAVATGPGQRGVPDEAAPRRAGWGPVERQTPITFYSCLGPRGGFCGAMSSGNVVYEGAAACGSAYALGDRVSIVGDPTGRVYVCEDRGWLAPTQVDVFWYREEEGLAWMAQVARRADVQREPASSTE